MSESKQIVNKLWNYCNILRDDGLSYGDYVEQLTYLLFLKMDDERAKPPYNKKSTIPKKYNWQSLIDKDGTELEAHYIGLLQELGKEEGIIGVIFRKAQNKIQDPAKLRKLIIELINKENWLSLESDVKGDAYEGLLEKNAADVKGGAGQYFTPRPLINAMVNVMKPEPGTKIHDPACGTGGFLLSENNYIVKNFNLDRDEKETLKHKTFSGNDIANMVARLCVMNLYLHGIDGETSPVDVTDSLKKNPGAIYDMVLTNPPFGKKSAETIITEEGDTAKQTLTIVREDFWTETCDLHTILRLPTGIFYAQGVKANVLFFDKKVASKEAITSKIWIYDLRTNINFTLKENPLKEEDLDDFVKCYNSDNRYQRKETERFKCFAYDEILKRDKTNLDIFWIKDESLDDLDKLPDPNIIANELVDDLEDALEQLREISDDLERKK